MIITNAISLLLKCLVFPFIKPMHLWSLLIDEITNICDWVLMPSLINYPFRQNLHTMYIYAKCGLQVIASDISTSIVSSKPQILWFPHHTIHMYICIAWHWCVSCRLVLVCALVHFHFNLVSLVLAPFQIDLLREGEMVIELEQSF